ncbi:hypothetical protein [Rubrivirga sp. IMCC43871]|uniref:hypothetical protein n=1 Tax=Rubrivirga sp. IMCC43871 TaxID=3391575 RepID=UPI00398FB5BD
MRTLLSHTALLLVASGCGSDETPPPAVSAPAVEAIAPDTPTADLNALGEPVDVPAAPSPPATMPPPVPDPTPAHDDPGESSDEMDGGHEVDGGHTMEDGTPRDGDSHHDGGHGH